MDLASHFGQQKTIHLLTREFQWPQVKADVAQGVSSCEVCWRAKDIPGKSSGLLHSLSIPFGLWNMMSLIIIMDLSLPKGNACILWIVDFFTKIAHFILCPTLPTAQEIARLYLQEMFLLCGLTKHLISDHGVQFTILVW